jgi:hypothetical protein
MSTLKIYYFKKKGTGKKIYLYRRDTTQLIQNQSKYYYSIAQNTGVFPIDNFSPGDSKQPGWDQNIRYYWSPYL